MRLDVWFLLSPVDGLSAGRLLSADKQQVELDFFFFFALQLIYSVLLISGVVQSDSVIPIFIFFRLFFHIGYHRVFSRVLCMILQGIAGFLSYKQWCVYINPNLLLYPISLPRPDFPFGNPKFIFNTCKSASVLEISSCISFKKIRFH